MGEADRGRGIYDKFEVKRTDKTDLPGEKHFGCQYFVLDLDHDQFAGPALIAYAHACLDKYPRLSADLISIGRRIELNTQVAERERKGQRRIKDPRGERDND